ncbi:MAG: MarR family transcriptional regulator [Rhodospirillales bacterium]
MGRPATPHQALELWRRATLAGVRGADPDLTQRQMALLLTVYLAPAPHTVRGLAATLGVSRPAVSRAADRRCALDVIRRRRDERDRRSIVLLRTIRGSVYLRDFAGEIQRVLKALEGAG